jgi:hypothetical protein
MSSVVDAIVAGARRESDVWGGAVRAAPEWEPVFSELVPEQLAYGVETIYEAYLVHYGRPRLFEPASPDEAVLLGDYLYAHGLVRIAAAGGVPAVATMAALIARCASLRSDGSPADGAVWVEAARELGGDADDDAVRIALARHSARVAP